MEQVWQDWISINAQIEKLKDQLSDLEGQKKALKEKLEQEYFKEQQIISRVPLRDNLFVDFRYRVTKSHRMDTERFKQDNPVLYKQYQIEFEYSQIEVLRSTDGKRLRYSDLID